MGIADAGIGYTASDWCTGQDRGRSPKQIVEDSFKLQESSLNLPGKPPHRGIGLVSVNDFISGFEGTLRLCTDNVSAEIVLLMSAIPTFETDRLLLVPVSLADVASYQKYFVDYEVIRHLAAQVPWPYPVDGVAEYFKNVLLPPQGTGRWSWGIRLKSSPHEVIGCVDLWRKGEPENRGFWLGRKFWGAGYMTESVTPVMDYAFDCLGFEKLVFTNALGNLRSRRVKEKTGARLIEVRPASFVDPQYTQHEIWELAKPDWIAVRRKS